MNQLLKTELARLRRADPAADSNRAVAFEQVSSAMKRESLPGASPASPSSRRRRLSVPRLALVGSLAAVALVIGTFTAPWSHDGSSPPASAYAVTAASDGSVQVIVRWRQLSDPAELQRALRERHVPAVVLVESRPGECREPIQAGIPIPARALVDGPGGPAERQFGIRPDALPAGSTLVFGIPRVDGHTPSVTLYLTMEPAPKCLASATTVK